MGAGVALQPFFADLKLIFHREEGDRRCIEKCCYSYGV